MIEIVEYDPAWPGRYEHEAALIRGALGAAVRVLEHAGSTAVPGLAAKPVIDIVLCVDDSSAEPAYAHALCTAGYVLVLREPDWFEHRLFERNTPRVNLHVFTHGCIEVARMLRFRDWLRHDAADRARYEATKRALASQDWPTVQAYADAKTAVVQDIAAHAERWSASPSA